MAEQDINNTSNTQQTGIDSGNSVTPKKPPTTENDKSSQKLWLIVLTVIVLIFVGAGAFFFTTYKSDSVAPSSEKPIRIGLSLDSVKIQRWADERDIMQKKAKDLNATVITYSAEADDALQISQIENLITQKVDVIIIVAHDAAAVAPAIAEAQKAGIEVIAYDRMTANGKPDLYLSFDSVKVGKYAAQYVVDAMPKDKGVQKIAYVGGSTTDNNSYLVRDGAMSVIDPLVKSGKMTLVYNEFTKDWSPSEAYLNFKKFLDGGGTADGVVTAYDGLAFGVSQALDEHKLSGKIPVSGQNGELQAMQRIVQGTQTMSAYKPGKPLAEKAIEAAIAFANGQKPETNALINNKTADIPSYLFDPIPVTKDNIKDTVVKDGTFTAEEIYNATPTN